MHLVLDTHCFAHPDRRFSTLTGAEIYAQRLLDFWCDEGHTATVISDRNHFPECKPDWLGKIQVLPNQGRNPDEYRRADVIMHHHADPIGAIVRAELLKKPMVAVVHNEWAIRKHNSDAWCDLFIFAANHLAARAQRDHRIPWTVCHPPVWPHHWESTVDLAERKFVTMVNLNQNKGGDLFIALAKALPEYEFLGVSGGYDPQFDQLAALQCPNVRLMDTTPRLKDDVFAQTRVLIAPTTYESFGMVNLEAACAGIPVVVTRTPGTQEAMRDAAWFIPAEKRELLDYWIAAIKLLMEDDDQWEHWSHRARVRALQVDPAPELLHTVLQIESAVRRHGRNH